MFMPEKQHPAEESEPLLGANDGSNLPCARPAGVRGGMFCAMKDWQIFNIYDTVMRFLSAMMGRLSSLYMTLVRSRFAAVLWGLVAIALFTMVCCVYVSCWPSAQPWIAGSWFSTFQSASSSQKQSKRGGNFRGSRIREDANASKREHWNAFTDQQDFGLAGGSSSTSIFYNNTSLTSTATSGFLQELQGRESSTATAKQGLDFAPRPRTVTAITAFKTDYAHGSEFMLDEMYRTCTRTFYTLKNQLTVEDPNYPIEVNVKPLTGGGSGALVALLNLKPPPQASAADGGGGGGVGTTVAEGDAAEANIMELFAKAKLPADEPLVLKELDMLKEDADDQNEMANYIEKMKNQEPCPDVKTNPKCALIAWRGDQSAQARGALIEVCSAPKGAAKDAAVKAAKKFYSDWDGAKNEQENKPSGTVADTSTIPREWPLEVHQKGQSVKGKILEMAKQLSVTDLRSQASRDADQTGIVRVFVALDFAKGGSVMENLANIALGTQEPGAIGGGDADKILQLVANSLVEAEKHRMAAAQKVKGFSEKDKDRWFYAKMEDRLRILQTNKEEVENQLMQYPAVASDDEAAKTARKTSVDMVLSDLQLAWQIVSSIYATDRDRLLPDYVALEAHTDANLGNMLLYKDASENLRIGWNDNSADEETMLPLGTEILKTLFGCAHSILLLFGNKLSEVLYENSDNEEDVEEVISLQEGDEPILNKFFGVMPLLKQLETPKVFRLAGKAKGLYPETQKWRQTIATKIIERFRTDEAVPDATVAAGTTGNTMFRADFGALCQRLSDSAYAIIQANKPGKEGSQPNLFGRVIVNLLFFNAELPIFLKTYSTQLFAAGGGAAEKFWSTYPGYALPDGQGVCIRTFYALNRKLEADKCADDERRTPMSMPLEMYTVRALGGGSGSAVAGWQRGTGSKDGQQDDALVLADVPWKMAHFFGTTRALALKELNLAADNADDRNEMENYIQEMKSMECPANSLSEECELIRFRGKMRVTARGAVKEWCTEKDTAAAQVFYGVWQGAVQSQKEQPAEVMEKVETVRKIETAWPVSLYRGKECVDGDEKYLNPEPDTESKTNLLSVDYLRDDRQDHGQFAGQARVFAALDFAGEQRSVVATLADSNVKKEDKREVLNLVVKSLVQAEKLRMGAAEKVTSSDENNPESWSYPKMVVRINEVVDMKEEAKKLLTQYPPTAGTAVTEDARGSAVDLVLADLKRGLDIVTNIYNYDEGEVRFRSRTRRLLVPDYVALEAHSDASLDNMLLLGGGESGSALSLGWRDNSADTKTKLPLGTEISQALFGCAHSIWLLYGDKKDGELYEAGDTGKDHLSQTAKVSPVPDFWSTEDGVVTPEKMLNTFFGTRSVTPLQTPGEFRLAKAAASLYWRAANWRKYIALEIRDELHPKRHKYPSAVDSNESKKRMFRADFGALCERLSDAAYAILQARDGNGSQPNLFDRVVMNLLFFEMELPMFLYTHQRRFKLSEPGLRRT
ncbi:unnamed protein product [Amoebophrya sp. A25]|nr:unnamed protein product [Amoebophrya sp. A25]|eukprot:GSA25T00020808001.1